LRLRASIFGFAAVGAVADHQRHAPAIGHAKAGVKPASAAATANPEINPRRSALTLIRLTRPVYSSRRDAATAMAARAIRPQLLRRPDAGKVGLARESLSRALSRPHVAAHLRPMRATRPNHERRKLASSVFSRRDWGKIKFRDNKKRRLKNSAQIGSKTTETPRRNFPGFDAGKPLEFAIIG
jgi:hypothetical protein